tara:strand:- start:178 stop:1533 length:1356 start_codon:yes stop_codon:yes gene_type:complete
VELKRILAKDSRRALEKVSDEYGNDALVISSAKVNGQTEVIVAIDLHSENSTDSVETTDSTKKETNQSFEKFLKQEIAADSKNGYIPKVSEDKLEKKAGDIEYIRMREIVDLIKLELASIRKEFSLSKKLNLTDGNLPISNEVTPLVSFFEESGMPSSLKALLSRELIEEKSLRDAIKKTQDTLQNGLNKVEIDWEQEKIHVLAGTSGCGKSLMAGKLAIKTASERSPEQVAIISYRDEKLGSWAQTQLIGAESGVSTYKADSFEVLRTLVEELGQNKTIIIDTPGVNIEEHLKEIKNLDRDALFHLVVPFDASESSINHAISKFEKSWYSVMISRSDEKVYPWPLISVLTNTRLPISYIGDGSASLKAISIARPEGLVRQALSGVSSDFDCNSLIIENEPSRELKNVKSMKKQDNLELKTGQIDPEMMLSDPLLMISKMVEKRQGATEVN